MNISDRKKRGVIIAGEAFDSTIVRLKVKRTISGGSIGDGSEREQKKRKEEKRGIILPYL